VGEVWKVYGPVIESLQYLARKPAAALWRRFCPDVLVQREIHGTLFTVSLRHHTLWVFSGASADAEHIDFPCGGVVWDLGCNIGLYSVAAAQCGCRVFAFDVSRTNVLCLKQTAALNGFDITAIHSPVTTRPMIFDPNALPHTETVMRESEGGDPSITYLDAAAQLGMPTFIKMDIQGGESEFLRDQRFREWIHDNRVSMYLEVHGDAARYIWGDFKQVGRIQYAITHE
jgi:FkbM family methyltransferase